MKSNPRKLRKLRYQPGKTSEMADSHVQKRRVHPVQFLPEAVRVMVDSATSTAFVHELMQLEKRAMEYVTAGVFYKKLFNTVPIQLGKDFVGWKQKVKSGLAEFISRNATEFPTSNSGVKLQYDAVVPIGSSYTVSFFEQESAKLYGMDLDEDGMQDTREYIDRKIDQALHFGGNSPDKLAVKGIFDFMNGGNAANGSIRKFELSEVGTPGSTKFSDKTGSEILKNILDLLHLVDRGSRRAARANVLVMGEDANLEITTKYVEEEGQGGMITVESALKKARPDLRIEIDPYFDRVGVNFEVQEDEEGNLVEIEVEKPIVNSHQTFNDVGAMMAFDDSPRFHQAPVLPFLPIRPYEHKGLVTQVNCMGLMTSLQIKFSPAFAYCVGVS